MSLDDDPFKRKLEEFKELGNEYRYRDQLMVQEFSLSMVAVGVLLGVLLKVPAPGPFAALILQIFGALFLPLLSLHLRNINQDRRAALQRRQVLRKDLEFAEVHGNVVGTSRISAPRAMVRFTSVVAATWVIWTVVSVVQTLSAS